MANETKTQTTTRTHHTTPRNLILLLKYTYINLGFLNVNSQIYSGEGRAWLDFVC